MTEIKVSIITVCYNCVNTIEETIKSVVNQTYLNIEYIIVDGLSKDGTVDVIKKYTDKISYWISEPDNGIYDAMNKGIEYASGKWINFMNSGDCFVSDKIIEDLFLYKLYSENIKVIYGDVIIDNGYSNKTINAYALNKISHKMPFCHQSSFIKLDILKKKKYDLKYKIAADYHFFYNLYFSCGRNAFFYAHKKIARNDSIDSFSRQNQYPLWLEYIEIRTLNKDIRWYWDKFKNFIKIILGYNKDII